MAQARQMPQERLEQTRFFQLLPQRQAAVAVASKKPEPMAALVVAAAVDQHPEMPEGAATRRILRHLKEIMAEPLEPLLVAEAVVVVPRRLVELAITRLPETVALVRLH